MRLHIDLLHKLVAVSALLATLALSACGGGDVEDDACPVHEPPPGMSSIPSKPCAEYSR